MDLISRQAAIDTLENTKTAISENGERYIAKQNAIMRIDALPSAQPKRGKWIYHIDDLFPAESTMECNQCHAEQPLTCDDEFCPHCGAKMEDSEDETD